MNAGLNAERTPDRQPAPPGEMAKRQRPGINPVNTPKNKKATITKTVDKVNVM